MIDCLIVGAGPAGLTAGIYLRRFHREIRLIDAGQSRASLIPCAQNYPGFPEGIAGEALLLRLREQFSRFGGEVISGVVTRIHQLAPNGFDVEIGDKVMRARRVLLATGVVDVEPPLPGFQTLKALGLVRFCPICDAFEYTNKRIAILGADKHAINEALFIKHYSEQLSFFFLNPKGPADTALIQPLRDNGIEAIMGVVRQLQADVSGKHLHLEMSDGHVHTFDALYCALGTRVQSQLALQLGAEHSAENGLVVDDHLQTTIIGLYAAGDVVHSLNQLSVATGQAAIAATAIHNSLKAI